MHSLHFGKFKIEDTGSGIFYAWKIFPLFTLVRLIDIESFVLIYIQCMALYRIHTFTEMQKSLQYIIVTG